MLFYLNNCLIFVKEITTKIIEIMIRTTSLQHYKDLKSKGVNVQLVTKQDLN